MLVRRRFTVIVFLGTILGTSMVAQAESASQLLQQAMYAEKTEGDLDKAIGLYEQILEHVEIAKPITASALYHLGLCYAKKGQEAKAIQYFKQIISDYPELTSFTKQAHKQLKKVSSTLSPARRPFLIWFKARPSHKTTSAKDLLGMFNENHPPRTHTFRFRTEDKNGELIGRICVPHAADRDKITNMLNASSKLMLIKTQNVYTLVFAPIDMKPFDGKALLNLFNENLPRTVATYRYHTSLFKGEQVGLISTDTQLEKDGLVAMIKAHDKLTLKHIIGPQETSALLVDGFERGDETPNGWEIGAAVPGVTYRWEKKQAFKGQASLCLEKTANRYFPIAQWTRRLKHNGSATRLKVKTQVKAQNTTKAIVDALFLDTQDEWIRHEWVSYIGDKRGGKPITHSWKGYQGTVTIPENTKTIVVGLQIYGPGTVWFDELEVSYKK